MDKPESIQDVESLIENGTEKDRFNFAVSNIFTMAEAFDLCPHCVALAVLEHMDKKGELSMVTPESEEIH